MPRLARFLLITAVLGASACSISRNVAPVQTSTVERLCIESNDNVLMKDFEPTLGRLIEERGIRTQFYSGARPEDCHHAATYVANWRWDFSMYLYYVRIEIFEDFRSVGLAEYDAALGGLSFDKFGPTEGKLRPLIEQLFPT